MSTEQPDDGASQLLCEHRWVHCTPDRNEPHCISCGLARTDYVQGTVMAALMRMDAWP